MVASFSCEMTDQQDTKIQGIWKYYLKIWKYFCPVLELAVAIRYDLSVAFSPVLQGICF